MIPTELAESLKRWALIFISALVLSAGLSGLKRASGSAYYIERERQAIKSTAGQGLLFGLLGGYRSLISDIVWIKAYLAWEKRDAVKCAAAIDLAVSLDPYMLTYRTMGAGMIGYDMPHWIVDNMRKSGKPVSKELEKSIHRRQTLRALAFIDDGLKNLPDNQTLLLEKAQIYLNRLEDFEAAGECYGRVMKLDKDPPVFVRRFYARCMEKTGRFKEALKTLQDLLPILQPDEPLYPVVQDDIARLKKKIAEGGA